MKKTKLPDGFTGPFKDDRGEVFWRGYERDACFGLTGPFASDIFLYSHLEELSEYRDDVKEYCKLASKLKP